MTMASTYHPRLRCESGGYHLHSKLDRQACAYAESMIRCKSCGGSGYVTDRPAALTAALTDHFGLQTSFTSVDIFELAMAEEESGSLTSILGANTNPRKIGKLLAKCKRYGIERIASDKHGAIWWLVRV
jgi:hypothetical protein